MLPEVARILLVEYTIGSVVVLNFVEKIWQQFHKVLVKYIECMVNIN